MASVDLPEVIPALEEPIVDPSICVGPGYSESKWIAEAILLAAREKAGVSSVIARLGQVCGGYNGYWNEREWFPAIVKSALHVKCLPSLEGVSLCVSQSYRHSHRMSTPRMSILHGFLHTRLPWS